MKIYVFKAVKYSLAYGQAFKAQGLDRLKNFIISMLQKGIPADSMHLLFCPNGFICHDSKANGQTLVVKNRKNGDQKYWVSKGKPIDGKLVTLTITIVFLLALLSQL